MIPPRQREAEAIHVLVDLIQNVDEWSEEHHDTAQLAAREAAAWLRRAKVGQDAPEKPKRKVGGRKPTGKPAGPSEATREFVRRRSGGFCQVLALGCTGKGVHLHHRLMRSQGGGHEAENLTLCCEPCHSFIHANPEWSYERGWLLHRGTV